MVFQPSARMYSMKLNGVLSSSGSRMALTSSMTSLSMLWVADCEVSRMLLVA